MSRSETLEERQAHMIIKYRKLKIEKSEKIEDKIVYHLSKGSEKQIMLCVLGQKTIGISYVRELKELVDKEGVSKGILVGSGKYTYSSKSTANELGLELIPPKIPAFDIFEHELIPMHEIVSEDERNQILEKFHAKPYQFPWIKSSDPISIILGAQPGDIIRIVGKSETAGKYESYRYVVKESER